MTIDIDRLIALCEKAAIHLLDSTSYEDHCAAQNRFRNACDPQTILALCAENKRLTEEVERLRRGAHVGDL